MPARPSTLTLTVACATVLAAGAAAGTIVAWPGPAPARSAASIADETLAQAGHLTRSTAAAGQPGAGLPITSFKAQHSKSIAAAALAARQAAQAAQAAAQARAAAQRQAALAAQQAPSSPPAAPAAAPVAVSPGSAQQIAMSMLGAYGWSSGEFSCLNSLWSRESGWSTTAANPSGAYGIPQALPGSKMASAGPDWQTSATTQIRWGLGYIKGQYGSPCGAWSHEQATGWY